MPGSCLSNQQVQFVFSGQCGQSHRRGFKGWHPHSGQASLSGTLFQRKTYINVETLRQFQENLSLHLDNFLCWQPLDFESASMLSNRRDEKRVLGFGKAMLIKKCHLRWNDNIFWCLAEPRCIGGLWLLCFEYNGWYSGGLSALVYNWRTEDLL